ncbi:MAG TPA: polyphenol oxidase family protein [Candidatus Cloacimonadota bacterium]|nr:polyphenol oxidase family protein [Candidatus Cloacimonadota bacterium]
MKVFKYIGDASLDYRGIMKRHSDLQIGNLIIPRDSLVIAEQTHSKLVHNCLPEDGGSGFAEHPQIKEADGLITNIPGQFLLIRTADCSPILIWDETQMVVCALHSGREGTRRNIAEQAIHQLIHDYSCKVENLKAVIGPGICEDHYEVSPGIYEDFITSMEREGNQPVSGSYRHLAIQATIRMQLLKAGIQATEIEYRTVCTYESPVHFSFRRDGTHNRQINVIGIVL